MYALGARLLLALALMATFFGERGASYQSPLGYPLTDTHTWTAGSSAEFALSAGQRDIPVAVIADEPAEPEPDAAGPADEPVVLRRVYRVTAYCDSGLTAAGVPAGLGQCAAPADIPFGALVHIPALGRTFVVTDRTARRFRYNTVDLFMSTREQCKRFGRRYLECEIILPERPARYGARHLLRTAQSLQR